MTAPKNCCGEKPRFVEFSTFSYWYCDVCKKEVSEEQDKSDVGRSEEEFPSWTQHWFF